jgi:hypothetical protein
VRRAVGADVAEDVAGVGVGARRGEHHLAVVCSTHKKRVWLKKEYDSIIVFFVDQIKLTDACSPNNWRLK